MIEEEYVRLAEEGGDLRAAAYFYYPDSPKEILAVRLMLTNGDWMLAVDPDDDTLTLQTTPDDVFEEWKVFDASTYFPWAAALGKHVRWAWLMENQRGYTDGLQLEFADVERGGTVEVQLYAMASTVKVRSVIPLEAPYMTPRPRG